APWARLMSEKPGFDGRALQRPCQTRFSKPISELPTAGGRRAALRAPTRCTACTVIVQKPPGSEMPRALAPSTARVGLVVVLEDFLERHPEHAGNPERDLERGGVLAELDRVHGLPSHADPIRELLLRHLAMIEAQSPDAVRDRRSRRV